MEHLNEKEIVKSFEGKLLVTIIGENSRKGLFDEIATIFRLM